MFEDSPTGRQARHMNIDHAMLLATQAKTERALDALRVAIDNGWKFSWRLQLDDVSFDPIRKDPRFQAMQSEIEAEVARQLERVQEMERTGEIAPMRSTPAH